MKTVDALKTWSLKQRWGHAWSPTRQRIPFGLLMAQVIVFHIPTGFRRKVNWVAVKERGKVIEFPKAVRKSA